eukprot:s1772_g11.t2
MAPTNLGNMGYYGATAMYVPSAVQGKGYEAEGIHLDFYRDYNASRENPGRYFSSPSDLDVSKLLPCSETALMLNEVMNNYLDITGDAAGVVGTAPEIIGKCWDTYFWYAPGCRAQPSSCVATAVASSWSNYVDLPNTNDMMLLWWVPDPTFLRLTPRRITFPEHNADEWAAGNRRSASRDVSIDKHVSQDLIHVAPEVQELVSKLSISLNSMNELLLDQLNTGDSNFDVACRWLRANEPSWSAWVPEKGKCFSQFGMYSDARLHEEETQQFLTKREGSAITCRACPSGVFSRLVWRMVKGSHSFANHVRVDPSKLPGLPDLKSGQSSEGPEFVPRIRRGYYSTMEDWGKGKMETAMRNVIMIGERFVPGNLKTDEEPLEILHCRPESYCSGGVPGTCAKGLQGKPCAVCPEGQTQGFSSGECADCGATRFAWVVAIPGAVAVPIFAYYLSNLDVLAQASPFKSGVMAVGIGLSASQSLAVIGLMSARWATSFETTSSGLQIMLLDLDKLGASCIASTNPLTRYLMSVAIFPAAVLWLFVFWAASSCVGRYLRPWRLPFTANTAGLGLQLGFGTMAAVALKPLMCYKHPTGAYSMIVYPNVSCGLGDHVVMQIVGVVFFAFFVVGFAVLCAYAAWKMPEWCAAQERARLQSFRFFLANFRFDAHWFILAVLFRGLGFALSIVVGTRIPPAQTALASLVLVVYSLLQALTLPWKVPMINVADMVVNASLLILVTKSIQTDTDMEAQFAEVLSVGILLLILMTILGAAALSVIALILKSAGINWNLLLTLGRDGDPKAISQALKECAEEMMNISVTELASKIGSTNAYDMKTLTKCIDLLAELLNTPVSDANDGLPVPILSATAEAEAAEAAEVAEVAEAAEAAQPEGQAETEETDPRNVIRVPVAYFFGNYATAGRCLAPLFGVAKKHTLKGLEYIHRCGVIHTDVKLENVLICRHDMTALVQEASQAHLAFSEQKGKLESLSKSQKKRLKKKNKKAAETADAKASDEEKAEDGPSAAGEAPEVAEVGDGEVNGNGGYCQSNGNHVSPAAPGAGLVQPVPPVRQRERFSTLKLEEAFAKLADFGNGIKVMDKAMFENLGKHCKHCNAATFWLQKVQLHASLPIEHLEAMELAMAPTEGLEQMPMHVPIGNLGQQVSMQPLSQQQQQLLQQINQKTVNQQHLQTLLLQQALQGTPQQSPQAQAQLPNLLTGRMLDPTGSLPTKTGTMPGVALPGGAVPAFYPWIYPLDPSMVGGGVLPGAWGVVNMQGSGPGPISGCQIWV